jgi:hypothetical protein
MIRKFMKNKDVYHFSMSTAAGLAAGVEEQPGAGDFACFLKIRRELNHFLVSLNECNRAENVGLQVHFLFMALEHLENVDREIRIIIDGEMASAEKIHEKIRSLKRLILDYIKQLTKIG